MLQHSCELNVLNLIGVVDWAEAEVAPFGLNLYAHQRLISKIHLKNGWSRYDVYVTFEDIFWSTFTKEARGSNSDTIRAIKAARIVGLLLSRALVASRVVSRMSQSQYLFGMMRAEHIIYRSGWAINESSYKIY